MFRPLSPFGRACGPAADAPSPWRGRALVGAPVAILALTDVCERHAQIASWPGPVIARYAASLALGGAIWGALVVAAGGRRAWGTRAFLVFIAALAVGAQLYFFARYHAYMNPRAVLVGTAMLPSVGQQLWSDRASFAASILVPVAIAAALPLLRARVTGAADPQNTRRMALDVGLMALLVASFLIEAPGGGEQAASPDVLYLASMGRLALARWNRTSGADRAHPGPRHPLPVPPIAAPRLTSLVFVLTESVRATDACSVPTDPCPVTPFTNALLPGRFGFSQMRALDSTTADSLAVLWSGLPPTASRAALHRAPLLWEYARSAGFDTAYFTAQNLLFANAGTWLDSVPLSRRVSATDLEPNPTYELGADDAKLVDVALRELPRLRAPFVAVVHLSNTHFPYRVDEGDAPFQPEAGSFGAKDATPLHNRYKDAIHRQDALVARLVRGVRDMPGGSGVAVVFASDHGEQLRERGAVGHTWGVYDEEIRIPFWIDAPREALGASGAARLAAVRDAPLTQLDVLPTLLDLMGIWDASPIARLRRDMPGQSLLRGGSPGQPAVLTNCTELFACAFRNWGALRGTRKLLATQNDTAWKCFDVAQDPTESNDLGAAACAGLQTLAEADSRGTPF
ncbi:MAG TPA: sulfatase-like hydrolase/transferase [Polyangiaceae bacterium]|nr:sulfatase-like hydrolase/transferase [Polyangiaceae bacterium]